MLGSCAHLVVAEGSYEYAVLSCVLPLAPPTTQTLPPPVAAAVPNAAAGIEPSCTQVPCAEAGAAAPHSSAVASTSVAMRLRGPNPLRAICQPWYERLIGV